ncbi:replication initiator protein [Capybara microvirus Cap3_SP_465]|nr:replication initiator protein [Capybara microvirus Cap3_SP_465]
MRSILEASQSPNNWFITLTYDNDHLPISKYLNEETGVYTETPTLDNVEEMKKFWKRFRINLSRSSDVDLKVRYLYSGEYGDTTHRPHFHAILFNTVLPDLKVFYKDKQTGFTYYTSELLEKSWKKGNVLIADCTFETCQYVAAYVVKKQTGKQSQVYDDVNIIPPYMQMSRRPGIGSQVIELNLETFWHDKSIILSTKNGGKQLPFDQYIKNKLDKQFGEEYQEYKNQLCEDMKELQELKYGSLEKTYLQALLDEEANFKANYFKNKSRKL